MDNAFSTGKFPAYTLQEVRNMLAARKAEGFDENSDRSVLMRNEIKRREAVAAGDVSAMTPGERLRHNAKA
jgi:hypothetical protein